MPPSSIILMFSCGPGAFFLAAFFQDYSDRALPVLFTAMKLGTTFMLNSQPMTPVYSGKRQQALSAMPEK